MRRRGICPLRRGPEPQQIEKALELARDLLEVIREKHAEALQQQSQPFHGGGPGGGPPGGGFQPTGANGYGGGMRYGGPGGPGGMDQGAMMMQQQQQQNPYGYQVRFPRKCNFCWRARDW